MKKKKLKVKVHLMVLTKPKKEGVINLRNSRQRNAEPVELGEPRKKAHSVVIRPYREPQVCHVQSVRSLVVSRKNTNLFTYKDIICDV